MMLIRALPFLLLPTVPAHGQTLTIVTDISPLAAIASAVVGPDVEVRALLPEGGSPHDFALRPSDAKLLHGANVVFWSGEALTPWMEQAIEGLGGDTLIVEAFASEGWTSLPLRELDAIEAEHAEADEHDHGDVDPHAWLDPMNAGAWAVTLADQLTKANLANVEVSSNAQTFAVEMEALAIALRAEASKLTGKRYLVAHDSFQYFETAFMLPASGAIALSDASAPGPAHIAELKAHMQEDEIACILTDPQSNGEFAALIAEGTDAKIAEVNPMGRSDLTGADFYRALLGGMLVTLAECTGVAE